MSQILEELFITGYIRIIIEIQIPLDVMSIIAAYSQGKDGTLIVESNETKTLESDYQYEFTSVVIKSDGILTVNQWIPKEQQGGKLLITALRHFIIEKGGKIDLSEKGFCGGAGIWTGESYNSPSLEQGKRNLGGGGGGGYGCYAGGGGYGTHGTTNTYSSRLYDNDGTIYGDKELTILHLGSGGGGIGSDGGGNGGGALKIDCIKFENYGQISVNGGDCKYYGEGCGSGGSIFIICQHFIMDINEKQDCFIHAYGGKNEFKEEYSTVGHGGEGGDGRIRITSSRNIPVITECVNSGQIQPNPYIG